MFNYASYGNIAHMSTDSTYKYRYRVTKPDIEIGVIDTSKLKINYIYNSMRKYNDIDGVLAQIILVTNEIRLTHTKRDYLDIDSNYDNIITFNEEELAVKCKNNSNRLIRINEVITKIYKTIESRYYKHFNVNKIRIDFIDALQHFETRYKDNRTNRVLTDLNIDISDVIDALNTPMLDYTIDTKALMYTKMNYNMWQSGSLVLDYLQSYQNGYMLENFDLITKLDILAELKSKNDIEYSTTYCVSQNNYFVDITHSKYTQFDILYITICLLLSIKKIRINVDYSCTLETFLSIYNIEVENPMQQQHFDTNKVTSDTDLYEFDLAIEFLYSLLAQARRSKYIDSNIKNAKDYNDYKQIENKSYPKVTLKELRDFIDIYIKELKKLYNNPIEDTTTELVYNKIGIDGPVITSLITALSRKTIITPKDYLLEYKDSKSKYTNF